MSHTTRHTTMIIIEMCSVITFFVAWDCKLWKKLSQKKICNFECFFQANSHLLLRSLFFWGNLPFGLLCWFLLKKIKN